MGLTITSPTSNPFVFAFTDPVVNPPDPKDFALTIDFTSTLHGTLPFNYQQGYSVDVTALTNNIGNFDRHGHHPAIIQVDPTLPAALSPTSGDEKIDFLVPYLYYARLAAGETVTVKFDVKITDTIDNTFQDQQVWLKLTGAEDPPIANDDFLTISNRVTSFSDGRVLLNDDDPDIHDNIHIVAAHLYGPVTATGGTVFPPEYVPMPAGTVGHTATAITFHANPYFQFLAPGEKASFEIKYTISDGHLTSSAFLHVTLTGSARTPFIGTDKSEQILGNNSANFMLGNGGNDIIFGRGGNDTIHGGPGNDVLDGGPGRDVLYGELGRDTFRFDHASDTGVTGATADEIADFIHGQDKIDISRIGNFSFIGTNAFGHVAGQLRYDHVGSAVIVYGDVNGDGVADFAIKVDHHKSIAAGDFVL
jgi:hypothetical protein